MAARNQTSGIDGYEQEALDFLKTIREHSTVPDTPWMSDLVSTLSQNECVQIFSAYKVGDLSEGAARYLLGEQSLKRAEEIFEEREFEPYGDRFRKAAHEIWEFERDMRRSDTPQNEVQFG